jgi:putative exporter of polyketide antibiotics
MTPTTMVSLRSNRFLAALWKTRAGSVASNMFSGSVSMVMFGKNVAKKAMFATSPNATHLGWLTAKEMSAALSIFMVFFRPI